MKHFTYYPKIEYSENIAVNITVRAKIRDAILSKSAIFYKYSLTDHDRPDIIATQYYGNPNSTWALFYANEVFDPRFDWFMSYEQFKAYIKSKYGSVDFAMNKNNIHHYILDNEYIIDKETFENNEVTGQKRAVTFYEYEEDLNEAKRNIVVLDVVYLGMIVNELESILK